VKGQRRLALGVLLGAAHATFTAIQAPAEKPSTIRRGSRTPRSPCTRRASARICAVSPPVAVCCAGSNQFQQR